MFGSAFEYLWWREKTASERAREAQDEARLAAAAAIHEIELAAWDARNAESIRLAEAAKRARKCKRRRRGGA